MLRNEQTAPTVVACPSSPPAPASPLLEALKPPHGQPFPSPLVLVAVSRTSLQPLRKLRRTKAKGIQLRAGSQPLETRSPHASSRLIAAPSRSLPRSTPPNMLFARFSIFPLR